MSILDRLERDQPAFHWGGTRRWNALHGTLREIESSVNGNMRTLETGCGASTVMFAEKGAQHTVISPTRDEHERVRAYLAQVGIDSSRLRFEAGFSEEVLPRLGLERCLDYVFIDGAHSFPYPAIDWYYATKALKIGGRLLLDDIPIPAVACVYRYMMSDPSWKLTDILDDRAAAFELVAEPAPEDYTLQPYNRHSDFGFAPLPKRLYLTLADELLRFRRQLRHRLPGLYRYWQRWHSSRT